VLASQNTCVLDCAGVPNGSSYFNACFECVLEEDDNSEIGCDGLWGCGDNLAVEDYCGVCNGDNSSCTGCSEPTACNYEQTVLIDDGSCVLPPSENYDCDGCIVDLDCAGVCSGTTEEDACGVCGGFGPDTWYADFDADGLGDINNSISSCTPPNDYVSNSDDIEPSCTTNDEYLCGECGCDIWCEDWEEDCAGECYGNAIDDACGICNGNGCYLQDCETYPKSDYGCDGTALSIIGGAIPEEYNIHSVYPNPFNPVTNIIYGIPQYSKVHIIIYNIYFRILRYSIYDIGYGIERIRINTMNIVFLRYSTSNYR
jgi:hypothetical protein